MTTATTSPPTPVRPSGPLAPTLQPVTVFGADSPGDAARRARRPRPTEFYGRFGNPTVQQFADEVARLEGAEAGVATASGMAAVSSVVLGLCSAGDHVVTQRQLFSGTMQLFAQVCPRLGIDVTFVDGTEPLAWSGAVQPGRTRLVFAETPSNPTLDLVDLDAVGRLGGAVTVVDSTLGTPLFQRPLEHGVDLVVHSATKALSGHNDATLGVVVGDKTLVNEVWGFLTVQGGCASPFDAWNGLRGLKTLALRLDHQVAVASRLAAVLDAHPGVARAYHPSLAGHPQHELATRQLAGGPACVTFDLAGGCQAAERFLDAAPDLALAPSFGGPDTLLNHPASMTHAAMTPEQLAAAGITPGQIRISPGLEPADEIEAAVVTALDRTDARVGSPAS